MHIRLITPAPPESRAGNRTTASRWRDILESLGHHVEIFTANTGENADLMIALHAWRSAEAIEEFARLHPDKCLIVAITGTDAYRFIHSHPEVTLQSIRLAHHLVGLHELISDTLPENQRHKMHVIYQSAEMLMGRNPEKQHFHVSVMGHLRQEKDPLRPALAARDLPVHSKIKIHHYGKAHTDDWAVKAQQEMKMNPRYHWYGEVSHHEIREVFRKTSLLVLPSRMEGGANVISEAIMAGVPVITSDIDGSIGLLGRDYPGLYPVENEQALTKLLLKAELNPDFYAQLERSCAARQPRFSLEKETSSWRRLLDKVSIKAAI